MTLQGKGGITRGNSPQTSSKKPVINGKDDDYIQSFLAAFIMYSCVSQSCVKIDHLQGCDMFDGEVNLPP